MAKQRLLGRDDILDAADLEITAVDVPEWGGTVLVRGLTGAERDHLESEVTERRGKTTRIRLDNFRARVVALAAVDEANDPLFTEADIEALGRKSAAALDRIFSVATRLSGLRQADIEELTENFPEGQSVDSISS